ncbi:MAG: hypothetical protein A3C71_00255 [Candidatus Yanofskybacteria bacterium RIFCSPHIGHO2_02_FULL_43_15c]|uniref:EamA domain-containing protein n=1 Tax=Candidatus Yanofskybacteria bacterium RIFCSPHIGHO2_02_FULL_43_15c TaxID=1802679 RepID=A0A1F8FK21_9BACT|nr:MAG: hypothetical protein A3C71_00255 [Candidatus Yanofskybacteria bacterium RIFCSPHIGHO2_02_FULL_43_15c]
MAANYLILFATIFLSALANIFLKMGSLVLGGALVLPKNIKEGFEFLFLMFKNLYVLGGLAALGISFVLWVWLLSKIQLNIFYPIALSTQIILIALASRFLFKEPWSAIQVVGSAIIIFGVFLLAKSA